MRKAMNIVMLTLIGVMVSCQTNDSDYDTFTLTVALVNADDTPFDKEGVSVKLSSERGVTYTSFTNSRGEASFDVPLGVYQASMSSTNIVDGRAFLSNGVESNIIVRGQTAVKMRISSSESGTIIIKELYVGGCQRDDGSGSFQRDKYVILYNNCPVEVSLSNLCLAFCVPLNAYGINNNYDADGKLSYANADFLPAASAIWTFTGGISIAPYSEIVVALNGAIDHTATYSNSVNLANADYYCTYDPLVYDNTQFYPSPSELIPTSHYLQAHKFGDSNEDAWPLSTSSPAFFIFSLSDETPEQFVARSDNFWYDGGVVRASNACKMVPRQCILDAVEVFSTTSDYNEKRMTSDVDAGYILHTPRQGHALMRKIDEQATEQVGRNVYVDTNNSTNDFVENQRASLAK